MGSSSNQRRSVVMTTTVTLMVLMVSMVTVLMTTTLSGVHVATAQDDFNDVGLSFDEQMTGYFDYGS